MQNLCDPAHVPYAHHGIIGRREGAGAVTIAPTPLPDPLFPFPPGREGQSVDVTTSGARTSAYKVQFVPPGLVRYVMPKVRRRPRAAGMRRCAQSSLQCAHPHR